MRRYAIALKTGKKIKRIRNEKELTQEEVAARVGIHVSTLGRIERGESNAPLQTLNKIAQALKTSVGNLIS